MKTAIIITGVAGFLGSHLAEYFLLDNFFVIGIDNFSTGTKKNISFLINLNKEHFKFIECDISLSDTSEIIDFIYSLPIRKVKYLFHFASPASPKHYKVKSIETLLVNSVGLNNCLKIADYYHARLVFASTSEIYGNPLEHPQSETYFGNVNSFGPRACYDEAKRFGEALIFSHNQRYNTQHGLVRIFNTYGPRMNLEDGRVIIEFLTRALNNSPLPIYGSGKQTRSFCYVSDLVEGVIKYARSGLTEPINIGNDKEFNLLTLSKILQEILYNKSIKLVYLPAEIDDPQQRKPNLNKAYQFLENWQPKVELKEGLSRMIRWLNSEIVDEFQNENEKRKDL